MSAYYYEGPWGYYDDCDDYDDHDDYDDYDDYYYEDIIREVMYEQGDSPAEIPHRSKIQSVRGYGKSQCEYCDRTWSTYQAYAVIDLKKQQVVRIYQQKCRDCGTETEPYFPEDEFYVMVEKAIEKEKLRRYPSSQIRRVDEGGRRGLPRRPPHRSDLCEMCGYGWGKKCWER